MAIDLQVIGFQEEDEPIIQFAEPEGAEPWVEVLSMVEDDYPTMRVEEINEGVGLICITGIMEGTGITINIIENLIGLLYRAGEQDLLTGANRVDYSTPFEDGTDFILQYELTALSDGAIIGGTFSNVSDITGFDIEVNEPAHIKYSALIKNTGESGQGAYRVASEEIATIKRLTQAEYDALVEKEETTFYVIVN